MEEYMSLKIQGGRDFPTRIDARNLKTVEKKHVDALWAITLAKAASQGSFEDIAALNMAVNSNATVSEPIGELTNQIQMLISALTTPHEGTPPVEEDKK
jgi:hypothetical protein